MLVSRKEYGDKILNGKKTRAIKVVYYNDTDLTAEQKKKHADAVKSFEVEDKKIKAK